jgi:hypothetical protein
MIDTRAIAGLVLALVVLGCGGGKKAPAPPPRVIVTRDVERTAALRSLHFVFKVEHAPSGAPGLTLTFAEGDLRVPDRLRARINGTFARTPIQSEIIIIGERSFLQDPLTKTWRPFAAAPNPGVLVKGVPAVIRSARGLRNTGSEKVGDADCYRLSGVVRSDVVAPLVGVAAGGRMVPFTVWVGKQDFRLRRVRLAGPVGRNEPDQIVRTLEMSKFDEDVTITSPEASG